MNFYSRRIRKQIRSTIFQGYSSYFEIFYSISIYDQEKYLHLVCKASTQNMWMWQTPVSYQSWNHGINYEEIDIKICLNNLVRKSKTHCQVKIWNPSIHIGFDRKDHVKVRISTTKKLENLITEWIPYQTPKRDWVSHQSFRSLIM